MDPGGPLIVPLSEALGLPLSEVGGKAHTLSRLLAAGHPVLPGWVVTTTAYRSFVTRHGLDRRIAMELSRKDPENFRWEELWDAALRLRNAFLRAPLDEDLRAELAARVSGPDPWAVRSSSPREDGRGSSFAGLHDSLLEVAPGQPLEEALRSVWASLWSDAALLYRHEIGLESSRSAMAVLLQPMHPATPSGVAFGRDPRDLGADRCLVEAVPGLCQGLVDGSRDPDHWEIRRSDRSLLGYRAGLRGETSGDPIPPLLTEEEVSGLVDTLLRLEALLGYPVDLEWTGPGVGRILLQARPVTAPPPDQQEDPRAWYLTLSPDDDALRELRREVAEELIPALEAEGRRLAAEDLSALSDAALAGALEHRRERLTHWMQVYWDRFIPFAHGARRLGNYYNDLLKPRDPYEFLGLLREQDLLATRRNQALGELARLLQEEAPLRRTLEERLGTGTPIPDLAPQLEALPGGEEFSRRFEQVRRDYFDLTYQGERLGEDRAGLLRHLLARARGLDAPPASGPDVESPPASAEELLEGFLAAVPPGGEALARELLETGRLSWRLRDDDNLLVGRLESQLLRALAIAGQRLGGRLSREGGAPLEPEHLEEVTRSLRDPDRPPRLLPGPPPPSESSGQPAEEGARPRQLPGQPASPGIAVGPARVVAGPSDLAAFRPGEVLVCDAIEPSMTHVVPLAVAVVERRGGMLVHGAIIARELGIPCVNGIPEAVGRIPTGQLVTVDGYLGVVTLGQPEFHIEGEVP